MNETGRYEYHDDHDGKRGSHKYWEIVYDPSQDCYKAFWGRIGAAPQSITYDTKDALKKISEKLNKGYEYMGEAISALEKDPEICIRGEITASGYKPFNPSRSRSKRSMADAKMRVAGKRAARKEERDTAAWFIEELEKLG